VCGKVVQLRSLEDPSKGAAACMALLAQPALLDEICDVESEEEREAIQQQLQLMLQAYFTQ
jgi:DNA-binding MarR family transcriptional regulator